MAFPSFFVMNIADIYLCTNKDNQDIFKGEGLLLFLEGHIFSPNVKFAAEQSKTGDPSLVNIRSCFNNKYWVAQEDVETGEVRIYASAKKPQEDTTDPACTLFRVSSHPTSNGTPGFQFFSISRSLLVVLGGAYLKLQDSKDKADVMSSFSVLDWERLVILPSQVTFRSEQLDGKYLCSRVLDGGNYHRFESGLDIKDPRVAFELDPARDGYYTIKSMYFGKYWVGIPEWIVADANASFKSDVPFSKVYDDNTLFSFFRISDQVYAIYKVSNKKFCAGDHVHNCLSAYISKLLKDTRLIVEERALKKKIYNVKYRLAHSMIHDEEVEEVVQEFVTNVSPDKEATTTLIFSQTESITTSWNNTLSLGFTSSVSVDLEVDKVPIVAMSTIGVELSTEYGSSHEWGKTNAKENTSKTTYEVMVPPLTTMKISLLVTKGACEVPFDYTESVLLLNGEWVTKEKNYGTSKQQDDGIYKGIYTLKFEFHSSKVDYQPGLGKVIGKE